MDRLGSVIAGHQWGDFNHAYGDASDAPKALMSLVGSDEISRENVYYDFLNGAVLHQGTSYTATPPVISVVIHILLHENLDHLQVLDVPLRTRLLSWLNSCAKYAGVIEEVKQGLLEGRACYERHTKSEDGDAARIARELLEFCEHS